MRFIKCLRVKSKNGSYKYTGEEIVFVRGRATVAEPFIIHYSTDGERRLLEISNYTCDGSSTPLGIWKASTKLAGVVHDVITREEDVYISVLDTHSLFRQILQDYSYTWIKYRWFIKVRAYLMWIAVVLCGWIFYKKRSEVGKTIKNNIINK